MKLVQITIVMLLIAGCSGKSLPLKTVFQNLASSAKFFMNEINKQQQEATPQMEAISGMAQSALTATGESLKNAANAADMTVEFPVGLKEGEAAALTAMKTVLGDLKEKVSKMSTPPQNALEGGAEASLIGAESKLKHLVEDMQSPGGIFVPKVPPAVTTATAAAATTYKAFRSAHPSKPQPPKASNTATQAAYLLTGLPAGPADQTGAGDVGAAAHAHARAPAQHGDAGSAMVSEALTRLNKSLLKSSRRHEGDLDVPMFHNTAANQSAEFGRLAKRMKSLESSLHALPSAKEVHRRAEADVKARNTMLQHLAPGKAPEEMAASASHDDITATKVRLMTDLVTNLDELGRFFGEDDIIDEDDNLSIAEDPKIALADGNLAAAADRLRNNAAAHPERFRDHTRLSELRHYLGHPVSTAREAPAPTEDPANNLHYLRNLRNYVSSLREAEKRRA